MKQSFHIVLCLLVGFALHGQNQTSLEKGSVSFISPISIYVKFTTTENINKGDTLFINQNQDFIPIAIISNKSSTSTVCTPISDLNINKGDVLFVKVTPKQKKEEKNKHIKEKLSSTEPSETPIIEEEMTEDESIAPLKRKEESPVKKQMIRGRISAASYSNMSDYGDSHRMRYGFTFRGQNIKGSKFSTENQITFRHTLGEWEEVQENLNLALKVYALSVKYDFNEFASVTVGRKINPKISSMGAIDGIQFEQRIAKQLYLGAIGGTRPNFTDYSLSFDLPQLGGYLSRVSDEPGKFSQTTLGFIEQRNGATTDRRLVYFQHSGEVVKNLNLFGSFEVDLYENINNEVNMMPRLTNLLVSLRYRVSKKLRLSASYDNRKNIIYYESYKNFIDRLIENETRQGLRFGVNYRPLRMVSLGLNSSMRFQKSDSNTSKNLNAYINFTRIPIVKMRASIRANFLQTSYLDSKIYGIRLSKQIIKRKLNSELYLRRVDYHYKANNRDVQQTIAGASLSLRMLKKLTLYFYYEGTFSSQNPTLQRFNSKLIQRF